MTPKRKLTANTPDGLLVSRTTHRDYKFVVLVRGTRLYWDRRRKQCITACESRYSWAMECLANPDLQNSFKPAELARIGTQTLAQYKAEHLATLAELKKRNSWEANTWCSRHDLAMKAVNRISPELFEIYIAKVNES